MSCFKALIYYHIYYVRISGVDCLAMAKRIEKAEQATSIPTIGHETAPALAPKIQSLSTTSKAALP
jgi:hypothetical protein